MASLLNLITTLRFKHKGDCTLLGVSPEHVIYVEEIYGEDSWVAQHAVGLDGQFIASVDEDYGNSAGIVTLHLPDDLARPQPGEKAIGLNFVGPRHRGLREPERVRDVVHPLSMQMKMQLVNRLGMTILPPTILGLAESYVLSEAQLVPPDLFVVCRRVRIAYALPEVKQDENNQPYDYDTIELYIAHLYDRETQDEVLAEDALTGLPDVRLIRPMDCLVCDGRLFVADGGAADVESAVHVWQIESSGDQ